MTLSAHPLVIRARQLADDLLAPDAERVDQEGVPASHLEAIGRGACCSTWFVQTQHHTPVQTLAAGELPVRERLLGPLARGELLSGVAYAHLRSHPRTPVRVRRERGGWRFDGTVPWYTGWGLNDVMLLAGVTEADEALFAFTEAREQPGLRASEPMRLAALTASRTVSLELDGLWLPQEAVALRMPIERWAASDRPKTRNANPAVFGVARAALALLDDATAEPLRTRLSEVRKAAYTLADHPVPHEHAEERLALRAQAYDVMRTATTAAVVAGGGRSMALTSRAQRLAREGLFLLVQGQTAESREAHMNSLVGRTG
ncbi:acyl-CoA dehydrogenase [Streptomyces brasiliensis]|uniref:Acyl-CoA dehydrogenase n=1 Tax=Streptomyces brasiliensis TaxID=1954 RepID=A0A917KU74_9ACTN|nr:acyl-CoA dehydrogenase [Streptomyces brasiliensis]GGJ30087.1 acyl-CoA dehydrogenase [Streptomyces brasiliensis]